MTGSRMTGGRAVIAEDFREAMGSVCCPVTVVTGLDGERPHGTTVSAFSSLSLEPPLVMVALDRTSDLLPIVRESGLFGINLMSHGQDELALTFARKGRDKFAGVSWREDHGAPRLVGASGWLACEVLELVHGGDHEIVVSLVIAAEPIEGAPLVYHRRQFGTHSYFAEVAVPDAASLGAR